MTALYGPAGVMLIFQLYKGVVPSKEQLHVAVGDSSVQILVTVFLESEFVVKRNGVALRADISAFCAHFFRTLH